MSILLEERIQQLEERCAQLESVIAMVPGHIYWKDLSGAYLGCNDQQAKSLGFPSGAELVGKTDFDLYDNEEATGLRDSDEGVMKAKCSVTLEETSSKEDGKARVYLSRKSPLYGMEHDAAVGVIGISIDITEESRAKQLQKENELSRQTIELLKTLGGSLAHELKTPLTTMQLYLDKLGTLLPTLIYAYTSMNEEQLKKTTLSDKNIEWMQQVVPTLSHCLNTTNVLVEMQLESISLGKIDDRLFQTCSISSVIQEAINTYPFRDKQRHLISVDTGDDFIFRGEPNFMKNVFWNLIKNALYFIESEQKGKITIWLEQQEEYNLLYFKDTAKGMPAHVAGNVFEQFFTRRTNGTGLGLSFCKAVMVALKGEITCQTREGEFATFALRFPKYKVPSEVAEELLASE